MHAYLKKCINELAVFWEKDPDAEAFSMNGSGGRAEDDEWSDGDVVLVVKDSSYARIYAGLIDHMSRICGDIRLWILEGESSRCVNFAFLFEKEGEQFLMDHTLFCESLIKEMPSFDAGFIFFDKTGTLTSAGKRFAEQKLTLEPKALLDITDTYLIYAYLNGKYYRRSDTAKLLYIQNTLRDLHIRLLQFLYPDWIFTGWWCRDIHFLSPEHQETVLLYAATAENDQIARRVWLELDRFANDARNAFAITNDKYPAEKELYVRRQLKDSGLPMN